MAAKKTRKRYETNQRVDAVRRFYELRKADPELSAQSFAATIGVLESVFAAWRVRYAFMFDPEDAESRSQLTPERREAVLEVMKKERSMTEIAKSRGVKPTTLQGWSMRYGDKIRSEMGLAAPSAEEQSDTGQTLASSEAPMPPSAPLTKHGKKMGRPTNAEREERKHAWREQAGLAKAPPEPEGPRAFLERGGSERQREFPFTAEPVQREAPPPAPPPSVVGPNTADFLRDTTARALRERDAVLTTLEIMMREGRLPGAR